LTLTELRSMVGALREDGSPALTPLPGIADLQRLADGPHQGTRIEVGRSGNLDDVTPTVSAAIYRIAQESITNSIRHARNLTSIDLRLDGDEDCIRLTVHDDGAPVSSAWSSSGYGVVGMTERAALLGGSLEAGPAPDRGWTVRAVLPRTVTARWRSGCSWPTTRRSSARVSP
jgi:signal transduction histidine kinase